MKKEAISQKEVEKIAVLARINLSKEEKSLFSEELGAILAYFKNIQEVSDDFQVSPFDHFKLLGKVKDNRRKDSPKEIDKKTKEAIKELFPQKKDNYLKVRTVIKNGKH